MQPRTAAAAFLLGACCALLLVQACSVYDSGLLPNFDRSAGVCGDGIVSGLERCDTAIPADRRGACPVDCPTLDPCEPRVPAGSECEAECVAIPIDYAESGDTCCPEGIGPAEDSDCGSCGDGVIGPAESCDPPEACVRSEGCARSNSCIVATFSGDADQCTSTCGLHLVDGCQDGDGCCPPGCDASSDNDCSATCGNGVLEPAEGEICEPSVEDAACSEDCDDGDACTEDIRAGTPDQCNVECANVPITAPKHGDGCCPPGANTLVDSDCAPVCGNGIVEGAEPCDGGSQCDASCQRALHGAIKHRYRFDGPQSSAAVTDSVGSDHGNAQNVKLHGDGSVVLAGGTSNQYVALPCAIVAGLSAITVEAWVTWDGGAARQRVFDFGGQDGSGNGTSYFYLGPRNATGYFLSVLNFTVTQGDTGNDHTVYVPAQLGANQMHHVAATFGGGTLRLYLDGAQVDELEGITNQLSEIDFSQCWLGRAQFDDAPQFAGTFFELRIYDQALTPNEVGISASMGPDQ